MLTPASGVTIISVTKNDLDGIRRTVESIQEQDFTAWNLAIIVSSASDSSLDYVKQLSEANENIQFLIPDSLGIYQGMNFALDKLMPNLTWFLNGGDVFANKSVLSIAHKYMVEFKPSILIGGYAVVEDGTRRVFSRRKWEINARRFSLNVRSGNHQAMLFDLSGDKKVKFDIGLELAADFLLVLEKLTYKNALRIPEVLVEVEPGGVSGTYIERVWAEKQFARRKVFGKFSVDYSLGILWTYGVKLKRIARICRSKMKCAL
jgi:glycosyltransferase involved in cell wall biosynthesis